MAKDPDTEVTVYESIDPIELAMIRNLLETAGIRFVVHGQTTSSLFGAQLGSAFGGLRRIAVLQRDVERTLDLFDEALGPEDGAPADEDAEA